MLPPVVGMGGQCGVLAEDGAQTAISGRLHPGDHSEIRGVAEGVGRRFLGRGVT